MDYPHKRSLVFSILITLLLAAVITASGEFVPLFPQTGHQLLQSGRVTVDITNVESGYLMVKHSGTENRLKVAISHLLGQNRYDQIGDGQYQTYPLSYGSGVYGIAVYEQAPEGKQNGNYKKIFGEFITVNMPDETMCFLYPNQYVWYTDYSVAKTLSDQLCVGLTSDIEKVEKVFSFINGQIRYDYVKALTIQTNYIPDADQTLRDETGICFDFASLFACMLRVQGVPTQVAIGKLLISDPPLAHAWNKVKIGDKWLMIDPTFGNDRYTPAQYLEQHLY